MPASSLPEPPAWSREADVRETEFATASQYRHSGPAHGRRGVVEVASSAPHRGTPEVHASIESRAPVWSHGPPEPELGGQVTERTTATTEPVVPTAPDPLNWRPQPTFRERVLSAVGTPVLVGILVFIAAIASAVILVLAQPHAPSDPVAQSGDLTPGESDAPSNEPAHPAGTDDATAPSIPLYVHVVGEVHSPGVVELESGDRVQQALAAAGGVTKAAVLEGVNLARVVSDGEQILVPDSKGAAARLAAGGGTSGPTGGASSVKVNLNVANADQLESLPRVGPSLAERILEWRAVNGAFSSVDQLLEVSGIGQKTLEGFRNRVSI